MKAFGLSSPAPTMKDLSVINDQGSFSRVRAVKISGRVDARNSRVPERMVFFACADIVSFDKKSDAFLGLPPLPSINIGNTSIRTNKMLLAKVALAVLAVTKAEAYREDIHPEFHSGLSINSVPSTDRDHWMRLANSAIYYPPVSHPCPQAPFGTAIVNTTSNELICAIANRVGSTGDPTQHGEITAIQHCTNVLHKKGLSPQEILAAWKQFSLYTNAEPCTMCLSAIRWAGFKEVIYGTSVRTIAENGRNQIYIPSNLVLEKSYSFGHATLMLGNVLTEETDPFFQHQFNESAPCPVGCHRTRVGDARVKTCEPISDWHKLIDLSHAADDRMGTQPTPKTPLHIEL